MDPQNTELFEQRYEDWLAAVPADDPLHEDLLSIKDNTGEKRERFSREIAFGTAGLRGIYGAGTLYMNRYTVGRATQGIADYILSCGEDPLRGVVLAYDCRYHSDEFAGLAAKILTAYSLKCQEASYRDAAALYGDVLRNIMLNTDTLQYTLDYDTLEYQPKEVTSLKISVNPQDIRNKYGY